MTVLSTYETDVADLLHDPNNQLWTLTQLDKYINEARRQVVRDSGCLRTLQSTYCTAATESYTFGQVTGASITAGGSNYTSPTVSFSGGGGSGVAATLGVSAGAVTTITFTNFGSGYSSAPTASINDSTGSGAAITVGVANVNTYDVLGINITWGTQKYPLTWKPWSEFSAMMRTWTNYQRQPGLWAVYGNTQFYLGPQPDQTYAMELDSVILPTDLADYVTVDPIPVIAQEGIKYYAAYRAKFWDQSYGESETFRAQYVRIIQELSSVYTRRLPNVYLGMMGEAR